MTQPHPLARPLPFLSTALVAALGLFGAPGAGAFPGTLQDWQSRYGAVSASGDNAQCQLCHSNPNGGSPWNAYGWDIREALQDAGCDVDGDGVVSNPEAFYCIEPVNSDLDTGNNDNLTEISLGSQPGWTLGANTLYDRDGEIPNQFAPADIGPLDPDGTVPVPPQLPPPPGDSEPVGKLRFVQVVRPGQSIQKAIDRARYGGWVLVLPGTYHELSDPTNGLQISRGLHLIGLSVKDRRVVLENAGNQRNGITVAPEDRQDCMSCHTDMAPPFPVHDWVEGGLEMREPMLRGLTIRGITIKGFRNNGLFTENVDGYKIVDVQSIDNHNYGIFPTLSKNGLIKRCVVRGSDVDSGIWVETSEKVKVLHNLVEGNVNGFEVSNSDDVELAYNESRMNTIGASILLLPDIFDDRPGAKRIDLHHNWIHDNNKTNTARDGSILSYVPKGLGILYLGVDDSAITDNRVENNGFVGIAVTDYCAAVLGTPFQCPSPAPNIPGIPIDPTITPAFLADQAASNNVVAGNVALGNGGVAPPPPFNAFVSDLGLLTFQDNGNCYEDNVFETFFSLLGVLPPCNP